MYKVRKHNSNPVLIGSTQKLKFYKHESQNERCFKATNLSSIIITFTMLK